MTQTNTGPLGPRSYASNLTYQVLAHLHRLAMETQDPCPHQDDGAGFAGDLLSGWDALIDQPNGATAASGAGEASAALDSPILARHDPEHIATLLTACRFCALFDGPAALRGLAAPGSHTRFLVSPEEDLPVLEDAVKETLRAIADAGNPPLPELTKVQIIAPRFMYLNGRVDTHRVQDAVQIPLSRAIRQQQAALVIAPDVVDVGRLGQATCRATVTLPPVDRAMLRALFATLYPGAAAPVALPADTALSRLPLEVIIGCCTADSPEASAARLACAAARMGTKSTGTSLMDVALAPSVRKAMARLLRDMARWQAGGLPWASINASFMLHGPPGVGKTLMAEALAGSLDVPLIATSYAACQAKGHLGDYLAAMQSKVDAAIAQAPCVFFLDEFDSFARRGGRDRNAEYNRRVVNDLLARLSRLHAATGVVVMAATNHLDHVDPALLRAGRFDRTFALGPPDRAGLAKILGKTLGGALSADVDLDRAAQDLVGQTGATAAGVAREALSIARDANRRVTAEDLSAAIALHAPPPRAEDLRRRAVHVAGHLVVAGALGLPLPERVILSHEQCRHLAHPPEPLTHERALDHLTLLLAGRAAERHVFGDASSLAGSGEGSDLDAATDLILRLECHWGLGDSGLLHAPVPHTHRLAMPSWLRAKINGLLNEAEDDALLLLRQQGPFFRTLVEKLMEHRLLERDTLTGLIEHMPTGKRQPAPPPNVVSIR